MTRVATLISTCSKYADVWSVLNDSQRSFWPELTWPYYYINDSGKLGAQQFGSWSPIDVPSGLSWSDNLLRSVQALQEYDYILLWMDDLILTAKTPPRLEQEIMNALAGDVAYLRLNPLASMKNASRDVAGTARIPEGTPYRVSTVFSLWRPAALKALIEPGESAWEFEIAGSRRSDRMPAFLAFSRNTMLFANLVIQGQLYPPAMRALAGAGLRYVGARPTMSWVGTLLQRARQVRSAVFRLLPRKLQSAIHRKYVLKRYKTK